MSKYYSPNESQMRTAVKGDDRHHKRRRLPWLRILLAMLFFGLLTFVALAGLMEWRVQ